MKISLDRSHSGDTGSVTYEAAIRMELDDTEKASVVRYLGQNAFIAVGIDMKSLTPQCEMITLDMIVRGVTLKSRDLKTIIHDQTKLLDSCRTTANYLRRAAAFTGSETIDLAAEPS